MNALDLASRAKKSAARRRSLQNSPCSSPFRRFFRVFWKIFGIFFFLVLGGGILLGGVESYSYFQNLKREIADVHKVQFAELGDIRILHESLVAECEGGNVLRSYLFIPEKNCDFFPTEEAGSEEPETLESAVLYYLTLLNSNQEKKGVEEKLQEFVNTWNQKEKNEPSPFLIENKKLAEVENLKIAMSHDEKILLQITFFPLENTFTIENGGTSDELKEDLFFDELARSLETAKQKFSTAEKIADTQQNLDSKPDQNSVTDPLKGVSPDENAPREDVKTLLKNPDILQYAESLGFRILGIPENATLPWKNTDVFDFVGVLQKGDEILRYFAQKKETGEIFAFLPDGALPVALLGLRESMMQAKIRESEPDISGLKKVVIGEQSGRENFLLLGQNGGNIDTIIVASINHSEKKIHLVSIPRDLYMGDYKINGYYARYGMQTFLSKMEEIIGQRISGYALIDFDVFIDAIDMVGGITVTLSRDVVDPTYKTFDDGEWGTLYFEKGTHDLSGVQALRLARSRATSSDFERAKRQHMILNALHDKASNLGIQNADGIIRMILALMKRVQTDISPGEAVSRFFALKDYTIIGGSVLSTQNALTSTVEEREDGAKQYILLPRENDWDLIKKFIWQEILK
ncbi:LCP family protein [Candidatus Peregrinibacteria bacterium]|nr:LCP family protein [Candidatus Peregrinibacteria bacterium]